jgi:uncharacterized protein YuzE
VSERNAHVEYDEQADAAYIRLRSAPVERTVDLESSALGMPVLVDLDEDGRILGFEILDAARHLGALE